MDRIFVSCVSGFFLLALSDASQAQTQESHVTKDISGWTVQVNRMLLSSDSVKTERALELLKVQLDEIVRVVPENSVTELKKVTLWFSPEYVGTQPRAEYHPGAGWLRENHRDPVMVKGIEFSNVRIFEEETRRMPNFALHELAHAFHDRVLPRGFGNPDIKAAYDVAKRNGNYDRVERRDSEGRAKMDRAYAMTNPQEFFAESTEAFFSRNDFYPYDRKELYHHDPTTLKLIANIWGVKSFNLEP